MKKMIKKVLLASSVFCLLNYIVFAAAPPMTPINPDQRPKQKQEEGLGNLRCDYIYLIEQTFLTAHIVFNQRNELLKKQTIEQYIKRLDPNKVYLLKSDVEEIKTILDKVFDYTKARQCDFLTKIQKILIDRTEERANYAKKFLGPNYKFDPKVEFVFDPDHKAHPSNKAESEKFLNQYIHFQISNFLAMDKKINEAKEEVKKSWDRVVKKLKETTDSEIYASYLDSFARSLDPHTSFLTKEVFEDFNIQMSLSLEGIGASLTSQDGFTIVEALIPGGAAARSGQIEPQDKILAVGQGENGDLENIIEMDLRDVVKRIRGAKGTKVRLSILRKKSDSTQRMTITLVRDKVKLEDEAASILYLDKEVKGKKIKIAVINFPAFYSSTRKGERSSGEDLKKLLIEARSKKNVDGVVLDLSYNGGGSLSEAVDVAGFFIKTGNIVSQSSRELKEERPLADRDPKVEWQGPLVVLTSRISASASEIVSGALRDYKRAVIVGADHTYGKGTVQNVQGLPAQLGALKVTIGMFFIPGGNSTQHRGVEADVKIPGPYSIEEIGEKSLDYSLPPQSVPPFLSPEANSKDAKYHWEPIKPDWINVLSERSKVRVEKNEEFKKILEELKKTQERGKLIKLTDANKDKEKRDKAKAARSASKEEKDKEYLKRPDIQEASQVLMDLIELENGAVLSPLPGAAAGGAAASTAPPAGGAAASAAGSPASTTSTIAPTASPVGAPH